MKTILLLLLSSLLFSIGSKNKETDSIENKLKRLKIDSEVRTNEIITMQAPILITKRD